MPCTSITKHYVNPANISYKNDLPAGHGMIVEDTSASPCAVNKSPYLNNCAYDAAGHLLEHIYGALNPPSRQLTGTFIELRIVDKARKPLGCVCIRSARQGAAHLL